MKCKTCQQQFEITDKDQIFYRKMGVPEPTRCNNCREKRRLVWRNEWNLYKRKCDLTGEEIISYIHPDKPYKVYGLNAWFADSWDPIEYGKEFNFDKPFFEQFNDLMHQVPLINLLIGESENSDYTNYSLANKNCYMISAADYNEDCFFSGYLFRSRDCMDCLFVSDSELCYECTDCEHCYSVYFSQYLKNCHDCIGCFNLRGKKYCIFNRQYTREEYNRIKKEILSHPKKIIEKFLKLIDPDIKNVRSCEDCIGNNLFNCKECINCYDLIECRDCKYVNYGIASKDCMDVNGCPDDELCYETVAAPQCYNVRFSSSCWVKSSNLTYCFLCRACTDCFGSVSLHRKKYCILNKQYTEEEYKKIVPKIIDHMKRTGEWGEYFPSAVSPFAYNETTAMDYFPYTKEGAEEQGYSWLDIDEAPKKKILSENVLNCERCKSPYKIIPQEDKFYRKMGIQNPNECFPCRRKARMRLRKK